MPKRKGHPTGRSKTAIVESDTIFFYLPNESPYGVFCQWHPSSIMISTSSLQFLTEPSSATLSTHGAFISFSCAEQCYMFCKALYFSDAESCARILSTPDPNEQKKVGQRVKGFNDFKWARVKSRVARVGNWYKFTQNERMRQVLLETGHRELAEASRRDKIWGIGFNAQEAEVHRAEWGENLLGKALMKVRGRLRLREAMGKEAGGHVVDWDWDGAEEDEEDEVGAMEKTKPQDTTADIGD